MTSQAQFESVDIVIESPPPYGFRLVQKLMDNSLVVSKLRQGGKAEEAGLKEGDILQAVNSRPCGGFNCTQALTLIDSASQPLVLTVKRKAGTYQRPANQPVIKRDLNFLPKKKPLQSPVVDFKPQPSLPEPTPEPPKVTTSVPLVLDLPSPQKPPSSEPTKVFVGSTYKEQKEEEKPCRVEIGMKSSILVEPPSNLGYFTDSSKKTYTDSAFFNDPTHKYPTLEEQVQLARMVAMSVLAPVNANSKGHKMFVRAKERARKYTTGGGGASDEEGEEPAGPESGDALHHMPKKVAFVPKLPEDSTGERMSAMSSEELELMRLQGRRTMHTNVAPQVCFSLADDLKNLKGKGGRLFAKRQAKAESWAVGGGGGGGGEGEATAAAVEREEEENPEKKEREQRRVMDKLASKHQMERALRGDKDDEEDSRTSLGYGGGRGGATNRLESIVKANRAAMTPWQTAAEFGNVERAFERLEEVDCQLNSGSLQRPPPNPRPTSWAAAMPKTVQRADEFATMQGRSPGYRPVKFPLNSSIEPPAGIPISDA